MRLRKLSQIFGVIILISILGAALTARGDSPLLFQEGLNAYQSGQFDQARERIPLFLLERTEKKLACTGLSN